MDVTEILKQTTMKFAELNEYYPDTKCNLINRAFEFIESNFQIVINNVWEE